MELRKSNPKEAAHPLPTLLNITIRHGVGKVLDLTEGDQEVFMLFDNITILIKSMELLLRTKTLHVVNTTKLQITGEKWQTGREKNYQYKST